jgi:FKBP-type peptidyl-prolyl cis-trans isomerase
VECDHVFPILEVPVILRGRRALAGFALLLPLCAAAMAGCNGSSSGSTTATSSAGSSSSTKSGVTVTGKFGEKPTVTVPSTPAPKTLITEVLSAGTGTKVQVGQVLVANYLGETWDLKDGKANVFDNSYDRKAPLGFPIGAGAVIKGWDQGLVGQNLGSRVLLSIPADLAYGATASPSKELAGHALVFVVDLVDTLDKNKAATGAAVTTPLPAGLPKITSASGKKPVIASVAGVKPVKTALSGLLISGTGDPIDPAKSIALQIVQTDIATGKQTKETWGTAPQIVPASKVLPLIPALNGQKVGSRAVAVTPSDSAGTGVIVVVDVIGEY